MKANRTDPEVIEKFRSLSTSTISDTLDKFGICGGCYGISPVLPGVKMAGNAYTVRYIPIGSVKGTVGDYIDEVRPGDETITAEPIVPCGVIS